METSSAPGPARVATGTSDRPMWALRAHRRGRPEQLVYEPAPRPPLASATCSSRSRRPASPRPSSTGPRPGPTAWGRDRTPVIPGHEVSGVVAALGHGTSGLAVGEEVYGLTDWYRDGAAADLVAVEARNLAPKPPSVDHLQAAALPLAGLTAWQALFDHGHLEAGQLAHAAGAWVLAAGRAPDPALLAGLGADQVIDAAQLPVEEAAGRVDLVLDLVGGELAGRSWPLVRPGGALVTVVGGTPAGTPRPDARWVFFVVEADRGQLGELARRVDAGQLRPVVGRSWPLTQGRQAFQARQHGGLPGKAVLAVADRAL